MQVIGLLVEQKMVCASILGKDQQGLHLEEIFVQPRTMAWLQGKTSVHQVAFVIVNLAYNLAF